MPALELFIDAKGMRSGAAEAEQALDRVGRSSAAVEQTITSTSQALNQKLAPSLTTISGSANRAAQSVYQAGDSMQRSLGAAGAGTALASSIGTIASALQTVNVQGAALAGSNALSSIARLGIEFGSIASTSGRLGGALGSVLTVVSRVSPWLALGSAALSIGSAFWDTSRASDAAAKSIKDQADAIDGLLAKTSQLDYARSLGLGDPRQSISGIGSALQTLSTSDRLQFTAGEGAGLYGLSDRQLRELLARDGVDDALDTRSFQGRTIYARDAFSPTELRFAGERLLRERQALDRVQARSLQSSPWADEPGYGTGDLLRTSSYSPQFTRPEPLRITGTDAMHAEQWGRQQQALQQAQSEAIQRNIAAAGDLGDAIFGAIGQGIAQSRNLGEALRGAMASVISDMAQQGLRSAGRSLFGAIAGGFGSTPQQQAE